MAQRIAHVSSVGLLWLASGCADQAATAPDVERAQLGLREPAWIMTDRAAANVLRTHVGASPGIELDPASGLLALPLERQDLISASQAIHDQLHRCAGFTLEPSFDAASAASAATRPHTATRALQVAYGIDNAATVTALMAPLQESNLRATIQGLADFPTRQHDTETGQEASVWIRDRWQGYVQGRADVTVALIEHEETPQASIALTIRGSKYPDELVILGGHMDSINRSGGAAPGADDNASGIAVLGEVARAALELGYVPERTVIFYAYAAEEVGLVGSAEIAEQALDQELNVVGVLQLDMTNFNPSPNPYLAIVTDFTDATLNQFARQLIDTYVGLPWKDTECGYACSDHGSWQRRGFPVHYVHEATTDESNEDIHTSRDTLALSDGSAEHSLHFARYTAAFMAETAKGAVAPVPECDASKPCPVGNVCEAGVCVPSVGGAGGGAGSAGASGGGGASGGSASVGGGGSGGSSGSDSGGAGGTTSIVGSLAGTGGASTGLPAQAGAANGSAAPPTVTNEPLACSCRVPSQRGSPAALASLLLLIGALGGRRRRPSLLSRL